MVFTFLSFVNKKEVTWIPLIFTYSGILNKLTLVIDR